MIKLAALKEDGVACDFLNSVLEMGKDKIFCRFLEENEAVFSDEIAVTGWSGGCPGKYFRTATHVLRSRSDERLKGARAFLGIKKSPSLKAIEEVLADMRYWPRPKKNRANSISKNAKRESVYFGAW